MDCLTLSGIAASFASSASTLCRASRAAVAGSGCASLASGVACGAGVGVGDGRGEALAERLLLCEQPSGGVFGGAGELAAENVADNALGVAALTCRLRWPAALEGRWPGLWPGDEGSGLRKTTREEPQASVVPVRLR